MNVDESIIAIHHCSDDVQHKNMVTSASSIERNLTHDGICISVVSNSLLIRDGLLGMLAPHIELVQVGSWTLDQRTRPPAKMLDHVVLIDGNCEPEGLLDGIHYWRSLSVSHVFICELDYDIDLIIRCIEAGGNGYTLKGASARDIATALVAMRNNRVQCHPEVASRIFTRLATLSQTQQPAPCLLPSLTTREWEVLEFIKHDYSNKAIADALFIEVRTVKHHVHNILEKLGVVSRREAARFAIEQGYPRARAIQIERNANHLVLETNP